MVTTYPAGNTTLPPRDAPAIRHIILPLDGSKVAEMAVDPAIALAHAFGADVMLVRCFELNAHQPAGRATLTLPMSKPHMPLHMASLYLAHIEERIRERGIEVHSHLYQWSVGPSMLQGVQQAADALVVIAVQTRTVDVLRLSGVVAEISDGATMPILFIPADWRSTFAGGHLGGLRVLGMNSSEVPAVAAYAQTLAEAFQGTEVELGSRISSVGRAGTPIMGNVTDMVVMPAVARLDGSWNAEKDSCAFDAVLNAGVALLVISE